VGELASFLPLVAIALLFWLMVVRPASRRQKAVARLQADLQPGQRVMLSSGIYGTVRSLADDRVHVEIAPGTEIEVARAAVRGRLHAVRRRLKPIWRKRRGTHAYTPALVARAHVRAPMSMSCQPKLLR